MNTKRQEGAARKSRPDLLMAGVAAAATAALFIGTVASGPAAAQAQREAAAADPIHPPVLRVAKLRDAGGLPEPGKGDEALNTRLTRAFGTYLSKQANGRYLVNEGPKRGKVATRLLTLEGDLSHVDASPAEGGGGYLCVLRLFQEGTPRRLVAQWSGTADSLRYLTANLRADRRVDSQGLLGDMGKRVVAYMERTGADDQALALETLLRPALRSGKDVSAVILPEDTKPAASAAATAAPARTATTAVADVPAGSGYRLKVASKRPGAVFVIGRSGAEKIPRAVYLPDSGAAAAEVRAAGEPVTLPAASAGSLKADEQVSQPQGEDQELIVLVRRKDAKKGGGASAAAAIPFAASPEAPAPAGGSIGTGIPGSGAPVGVMEGMRSRMAPADHNVARLLRTIASDPPGTWAARRVVLHISPRPATTPVAENLAAPPQRSEEEEPIIGVTPP